MINFQLDTDKKILHVQPEGELEQEDFQNLASVIDPFILEHGMLKGIIIETPEFPGWENVTAMLAHFKFVKNHHEKVQKVALVTDSSIADIVESLSEHFVDAEVRHFPYFERVHALAWLDDE